ncbi:MAG: hypothetical protein V1722_02940 [Candidatus Micrarchaeota archaeon]
MLISASDFVALIRAKPRQFKFTRHALERAEKRVMSSKVCEEELLSREPQGVLEQQTRISGERKFRVYYKQDDDKFHCYIVVLNKAIRVITMMRISKELQVRWR